MAALSQHLRILLWKNWLSVKRQLVSVGAEECGRGSLETPGAEETGGHCREEGCADRMAGGW